MSKETGELKRVQSLLLAVVPAFSLIVPSLAYADVTGGEWYAEAAEALRKRGIMNGVENDRFVPESTFTRAQLAAVLYRMAGSPAVSGVMRKVNTPQ